MKRVVTVLAVAALVGVVGCGKSSAPATSGAPAASAPAAEAKAGFTAVFGTTVAKKAAAKVLAKKNGNAEATIYLYSFPTEETYPAGDAYGKDDFFLEATIKAEKGKDLVAGEYKGEQLALTLHTKEMNYLFTPERGSIVITEIANGKMKGEFKLDDGSTKFSGPFEMDLL